MLKVPEAFRAELEDEIAEKRVIGAQTGCLLLVILFPLFGVLDYVMYPEAAFYMGRLRLLITPLEIINLFILRALVRRNLIRRWIRPVEWAIIYPPVFALDLIILRAGGADSPYYAGLSLILLGMMVSMPWNVVEMGANALFIWLQYAIVMWAMDPEIGSWTQFVSNNFFMLSTVFVGMVWTYTAQSLRVKEFLTRKELAQEKERSEQLLLNILPAEVADELRRKGRVEARACPSATILFTDFAGFTSISNQIPAAALVQALDRLFSGFDEIITRHGLEKLKTIGDAYMCVGGLPTERPGHLVACILAALEIIDFLERDQRNGEEDSIKWQARVGIHKGPVIAGVIGNRKFAYDVWGDTVNLASRLEASSEPGKINVTSTSYEELKPFFVGLDRGYLPVKGKGPVAMTFVKRLRPEFSADEQGFYPNAKFWQALRSSPLYDAREVPKPPPVSNSVSVQQRRSQAMASESNTELWKDLRGLTDGDLRHLRQIGQAFDFKLGEQLVTQDGYQDALIVIEEGHVGVRLEQDDAKIDISVMGPGDLIGEMSFVTGDPASASVVAIEAGSGIRLPRKDMDRVMQEDVGFSSRVYRALANLVASRLRETNSRLPPLSLLVEEVAHTKLHHSMITGRVGSDTVPAILVEATDLFKEGMHQLDRQLLRATEITPAHRQQTKDLCDMLKARLTEGMLQVADRGQAFQDGVGSYVFRETFPYFMLSRMIDRSFSKPRGYAGDYYTIELIHLLQPQGDSRLGPLIDQEYLLSPPCQAVRNRRAFMHAALTDLYAKHQSDELFQVTSLASGAARELFDFMATLPNQTSVFASLLDIDIEALTYSNHLAHELGLQNQLLFAKENVLHLALGRGKTRLPPQDMVYSIGLADYLRDDVVVKMLNWIYDTLKPGGTAAIGNFSVANPDKDFMDHILDWRLYHRSNEDMERLFNASRFGEVPVDVRCESAGVNLVAFCTKPG